MECSCVRPADMPGASKLYIDLIQHFDRVEDLYPYQPNRIESLIEASRMDFPDSRRAALVSALAPLNEGNPSLAELAKPGTVAIVTGQQVGLFSGPAYSVYKALTAIKAARTLVENGVPAVPVFWLATEDHDYAEVNHVWMFGADHRPVKIALNGTVPGASRPVGGISISDVPVDELRHALEGLPFADEAVALVESAYAAGQTMGSAFARLIRGLFDSWGLLLIDPMDPAIREIAAPLMKEAVERMPELVDALMARSKELVDRGYHAQVMVDHSTSLAFLLEDGERLAMKRAGAGEFLAHHKRFSVSEIAGRASELSPNALLRPVMQDYILPTAAYIGGPAELAYLAQSQVIYEKLSRRQPAAFPRAGFTLVDERSRKRMQRYQLGPTDLFVRERTLQETIAGRLVPAELYQSLERTKQSVTRALDGFGADLDKFDVTLAAALKTSRRKIEYQVEKIARKTASQILARDEQARRDAALLSGLVYPESHLQERLYSFIPFYAKFGPGLMDEIYSAVRIECPDHQFAVV